MKNLINYLSELNTSDNSWGLYVNPQNIDSYRIGQVCFENGGLLDKYVFVDTLDRLSFGFQSTYEILETCLSSNNGVGEFTYKCKKSKCDVEAIFNAYLEGKLDKNFYAFLEKEISCISNMWSTWEAENFVDEVLPDILNREKTNG